MANGQISVAVCFMNDLLYHLDQLNIDPEGRDKTCMYFKESLHFFSVDLYPGKMFPYIARIRPTIHIQALDDPQELLQQAVLKGSGVILSLPCLAQLTCANHHSHTLVPSKLITRHPSLPTICTTVCILLSQHTCSAMKGL